MDYRSLITKISFKKNELEQHFKMELIDFHNKKKIELEELRKNQNERRISLKKELDDEKLNWVASKSKKNKNSNKHIKNSQEQTQKKKQIKRLEVKMPLAAKSNLCDDNQNYKINISSNSGEINTLVSNQEENDKSRPLHDIDLIALIDNNNDFTNIYQ